LSPGCDGRASPLSPCQRGSRGLET
jgi:hypothetical protein